MSLAPPTEQQSLEPDFDLETDYESLVMDTCALLARTDCRFHISGFGQSPWPVDIAYALSSVMEQLPAAVEALGEGTSLLSSTCTARGSSAA